MQRTKCHIFFQQLHQSAAVPDPDDEQQPNISKGSAVVRCRKTEEDPWDSWTYRLESAGPLTVAVQSECVGLPVRSIGHTCPYGEFRFVFSFVASSVETLEWAQKHR